MARPTPEEIAQELLSRGISPDEIARVNPSLGRQASAGMLAPRLRAPDKIAERGAYIRDYGKINADRDTLGNTYPMTADLERFHALNKIQRTGGIQHQDYDGWERAAPWNWPGMIGHAFAQHDPEVKEMSGIASGLQGKARPVGSGATSDFEQRLYRMGVPSPDKSGRTNTNIITYQKGVMAEEDDRLAFQEEFLRRNGSLSGSQQAWSRYVRANPYTITQQDGRTLPNGKRADWRDHFGLTPSGARVAASPPARSGGASSNDARPGRGSSAGAPRPASRPQPAFTKAQIAASQIFKGANGTAGSKARPFVPTTAAEFRNLAPGAWYIDTDGKLFQKGGR